MTGPNSPLGLSQAPGPGHTIIANNIAAVAQGLAAIAGQIAVATGQVHRPAVVSANDGTWAVYCTGCSDMAQQFVPCQAPEDKRAPGPWPPEQLFADVNKDAVHKLEEVRKVAAAVLMDSPAGDPRQFVAQQVLDVLKAG